MPPSARTRVVNSADSEDELDDTRTGSPETVPSADEAEAPLSDNTQTRRYATRATNDPHPARSVGLGKKSQGEIRKEAQRKRDEKDAEYSRKEADLKQRELVMQERVLKLAELERSLKARRGKSTMEKLLEDEEMFEKDAVEDQDIIAQATSRSDEDEDHVDDRERQSKHDSDKESSQESYGSDDEAATGAKRKPGKAKAQKSSKKKRRMNKEIREEMLAEIEKTKKTLGPEETDSTTRPSRPKSTAKSTSKSTAKPTSASASKSSKAKSSTTPKSSSKAPSISLEPMGLKADWQSAVSRWSQTPASKSQASSSARFDSPATASSSQGTPAPRNSAAAHRAANAKRTRRQNSFEYIGGFTDSDVTVSLGTARRSSTQLAQVVSSTDKRDESEERETEGAKKKRRARSAVSEEKSLSLTGESEHPWVFARGKSSSTGDDNLLMALVQKLIDSLWPSEHYDVNKSDKVYKIARQAVIDWRGRFATRIKTAVKQELTKQGSAANIRVFVESALSRSTGLAFWATYDADTDTASGALQSPYVLKSFAAHLAAIQGSRIKPHETGPARGALALAATAVQYVFTTWRTGTLDKSLAFNGDTYSSITDYWYAKSVAKMIARGKYKRCLDLAATYIEASWMPHVVDDDDDISVCDPEIPPQSDHEDGVQ
ncbi:hypothetical protein EVJ58_g5571 [Rhodofomes roseus]|uniref:DUF6532 domain-containing protein n=1 Tax=Rhodofomes roseus TaxID=34475 RepID=A0A4Y9YE84_9APHY|nr:hypothetical protein EVJ58_g5571 [Rhodofomes roseus]